MSINVNLQQQQFQGKLELAYPKDLKVQDVLDVVEANQDLQVLDVARSTNRVTILARSNHAKRLGDVLNIQIILRKANVTLVLTSETKLAGIGKDQMESWIKQLVYS